jgi:6-phosphogluconolactonase
MADIGDHYNGLVVCRDAGDMAKRAARLLTRLARKAVRERGRFTIALSGGSTPRAFYERLAAHPFSSEMPWRETHLFWGDERFVPPDHPESNYRMADEALISRVPIPPGNVHRMPGEKTDPQAAADAYEETLRRFFGRTPSGWPSFDAALLGIGLDGHTASLFPGSPALNEAHRWVAAPYVEKLSAYRLTLTPPVFNHAERVIFLAAGREKGAIVRELLRPRPKEGEGRAGADLPAGLIRPIRGAPLYFLDRSAARLVEMEREGKTG